MAHRIEHSGHNILARKIVKDDFKQISQLFQSLINNEKIDVVISTGGTGLTGRDITPEVMKTLFEIRSAFPSETLKYNSHHLLIPLK